MTQLKVLVVDDEPGLRLGVERTLKRYVTELEEYNEKDSYDIVTVENGKNALEQLEQQEFDILILDHKLPDIQGLEILAKIKEEKRNILTIMVTAFASLEVAISATKSGAFDFLAKPFTPDELRNRIDKAAKHLYLKRKAAEFEKEKKQIRFQFIRVLAHELKAPLAAIDGYLNMMKGSFAGPEIVSYQNMIERSMIRTDGMRKLIYDILDLTRIESGNVKRELQDINLVEMAQTSFEGVMVDAQKRGINLELDAPDQVIFNSDGNEMQIVFNNLVTNAIKYNKDGGSVHLSIKSSDEYVQIDCRDTGIGMDEEEMKKLFGEFSRIKNSKTKDIMGSGLGLSILQKIVDQYHGKIDVSSEPDVGSTFSVLLKR